jgi:hypothetical protein
MAMKGFRQYISEGIDVADILGRNLKAKSKYSQLLKNDETAAGEFIQRLTDRKADSNTLITILKDLTTQVLSPNNAAQLTKGDGLAKAYTLIAQRIKTEFPQLSTKRIETALWKPDSNTLDIHDAILDQLYPDLRDV